MTLEDAVTELLRAAGLDPTSAELAQTPRCVSELWRRDLLAGYQLDAATLLAETLPAAPGADAVFAFDLACHGLCPHHLVPFFGRAHLVYLPGDRLAGLGRLGQLVACYTQRLTLQEHATLAIAEALVRHLGARGAGCVLETTQLCLSLPDDRHRDSRVVTTAFVGALEQRGDLRERLLRGAGRSPQPSSLPSPLPSSTPSSAPSGGSPPPPSAPSG